MHFMQHLEDFDFKLGTLGSDLSFAKFKKKKKELLVGKPYVTFIFVA